MKYFNVTLLVTVIALLSIGCHHIEPDNIKNYKKTNQQQINNSKSGKTKPLEECDF